MSELTDEPQENRPPGFSELPEPDDPSDPSDRPAEEDADESESPDIAPDSEAAE